MITETMDTMSSPVTTSTTSPASEAPSAPRPRRGFAAMDREAVRAIAKRGGVAAHVRGTAHEFTQEEARIAGRKGGLAAHRANRAAAGTTTPGNEGPR